MQGVCASQKIRDQKMEGSGRVAVHMKSVEAPVLQWHLIVKAGRGQAAAPKCLNKLLSMQHRTKRQGIVGT